MGGCWWLRWGRALVLLAGAVALNGCKAHDDAVAAAEQMAETATTMQQYYAALDGLVVKDEEAERAQQYLLGVTFGAEALKELEQTRAEIAQRTKLAASIAHLSGLFTELTDTKAATDAVTEASALDRELVAVKLEGGSGVPAQALQAAVTSLVNAVRARDEVKAAKLLDPLLVSLCAFFDAEKPLYVSTADRYYLTASSNARELIRRNQVATNERYQSSLEPFGLEPDVHAPELLQAVQDDMNERVAAQLDVRRKGDADSANALSASLHRMQWRVDAVAHDRPMRARVPPLTLQGVRAWIAEVQKEAGVTL